MRPSATSSEAPTSIVARAAAQVLREQARAVLAEVEQEAGLPAARTGRRRGAFILVHRDVEGVPIRYGTEANRSAFSVPTPFSSAPLLRARPAPAPISGVRRRDVRRAALDHRHVGAVLPEVGADVVRGLLSPAPPPCGPPSRAAGWRLEWCCVPSKLLGAGISARWRSPTRPPSANTSSARGCSVTGPRAPPAPQRPLARPSGTSRRRWSSSSSAPSPDVHLQPVADLVLRAEHRVVPRWGMWSYQTGSCRHRLLCPVAPGVAGTRSLDDDRRHAQPAQPLPRPMPPWPPPMMTTSGCLVSPSMTSSCWRRSSGDAPAGLRTVLGALVGAGPSSRAGSLIVSVSSVQARSPLPGTRMAGAAAPARSRSRTGSTPPASLLASPRRKPDGRIHAS